MNAPWRNALPISLEVCGTEYEIRSDFRVALDICSAMSDPELSDEEKALVSVDILYPAFESMPPEYYQEALGKCCWFINGGEDGQKKKGPTLVSWEQDFSLIVAPVNRILGKEVRALEYLHWWTFLSAYYELGDCTFAQIVRIRDLRARGKPLDKSDREWYRRNQHLVDFKVKYTEAEQDILKQWGVSV